MPPITTYSQLWASNDANTAPSRLSMLPLCDSRVVFEDEVGHRAQILHALCQ
jgi:hypothetical protein